MVMPMPNVASDPKNHYVVEGVAQQHAFRIMEEKGLDFVGVYHSHPRGAAVPSLTDIRQSIGNDVIHVIVSLRWKEAVIKAYRLFRDSDRYLRVNIDVTGSKGASRFRTSGTRNLRAFRAGDTLDADQWRDWRVWTSGGSY
jgi:proteasome lid subunit RPN8/RPN11